MYLFWSRFDLDLAGVNTNIITGRCAAISIVSIIDPQDFQYFTLKKWFVKVDDIKPAGNLIMSSYLAEEVETRLVIGTESSLPQSQQQPNAVSTGMATT